MLSSTIYVDSRYGNDTWDGTLSSPVKTLSYAVTQASAGGIIILQAGDGSSYGSALINKNITIQSAYGSLAKIGSIDVTKAQCLFERLHFDALAKGITVQNDPFGSVSVRECLFENVDTAIDLKNVNYISILRNTFKVYSYGIKIDSAVEVCASSNTFSGGLRAVEIATVDRLDLWRNTIYGAASTGVVPISDIDARVIYRTLTASNIANKLLQLPGFASVNDYGYDVAFNVVNGPSFNYGTDYTVVASGSTISWDGFLLENYFEVGDVVRVIYSEGGASISGDAIRVLGVTDSNSRIDSNNIVGTNVTDISIGVYFNNPMKIRFNNFNRTDIQYQGGIPSSVTGNFTGLPDFVDPINNDFRLLSTSPDIDAGDPVRWNEIYDEMGLGYTCGGWTCIGASTRENIAYLGRDLDAIGVDRVATGTTGDVGSHEYNIFEGSTGSHVAEYGYDFSYPGSESGPYATLDRGFTASNPVIVKTNPLPIDLGIGYTGVNGMGYGRYNSQNLVLSDTPLVVGQTENDAIFIYPSYPSYETGAVYVSPDGNDGYTGTPESPYRTIGRALQDPSSTVIVESGIYPTFMGVSGKHVIGVRSTYDINLGMQMLSGFTGGAWTGTGTFSFTSSTLQTLNGTSILSNFIITPDLLFKCAVSLTDYKQETRLSNGTDTIKVVFDKDNLKTLVSFGVTGGIFNYYAGYTGVDLKTYLSFGVVDSVGMVTLHNAYMDRAVSFNLYTGYSDPYSINFVSYTGICRISDLSISSDNFSGFTAAISTQASKKVFGIMGATGING